MVEDSAMFYIILSGTVKVYVITPTASHGYGQEVAILSVGEVRWPISGKQRAVAILACLNLK
jgi:hypothetical protein